MLNKVSQPCNTNLICSPAVAGNTNSPVLWVVVILGLKMVLCFEDEERW
jgi:hypothetical protein